MVAAIIINDKSVGYVSSHLTSNVNAYLTDGNAKTRIDMIQTKYQCCGSGSWLDWKRVGLNSTATTTTMNPITSTLTTVNSNPTTMISQTVSTTPTNGGRKRDVNHVLNHHHESQLAVSSRKKRDITYSNGGVDGLPLSFGVTLPPSCCASDANLTSNGNDTCTYYHYLVTKL